jgi:hypothetical protein
MFETHIGLSSWFVIIPERSSALPNGDVLFLIPNGIDMSRCHGSGQIRCFGGMDVEGGRSAGEIARKDTMSL